MAFSLSLWSLMLVSSISAAASLTGVSFYCEHRWSANKLGRSGFFFFTASPLLIKLPKGGHQVDQCGGGEAGKFIPETIKLYIRRAAQLCHQHCDWLWLIVAAVFWSIHLYENPRVTSWWARYMPELCAKAATWNIQCKKKMFCQEHVVKNYVHNKKKRATPTWGRDSMASLWKVGVTAHHNVNTFLTWLSKSCKQF